MSRTIAVFGAGTGLGSAIADRFGREGYRVALVARRPGPLQDLARKLNADGIDAHAFPADLTATTDIPAVLTAIEETAGPIDVVEYAPITTAPFVPAAELTAETMRRYLDLYLFTPMAIVGAVVPGMIERGDGAILVTHGASAIAPMPGMSGVGPAMAAARNYLGSLHGELATRGVYVGTINVNALVRGSAGHRAITSGELPVTLPPGVELPSVAPEDLAERYWEMVTTRKDFEFTIPALDPRPH
ncbi:SDR family NAD(P)-dependent oxidoreductase [Cryptosporangium japonicum]|uniref:SDR family NAD(P)-dependent oxidoreductase n=1 Tax=Cryptosporangium japonicum TaxID=80872 RepID=A0ABN0TJX1_9ACTN